MARRRAGRHARNVRRFTPRRWLPFLVLLGVVAATVAVGEQVDDRADPDVVVTRPAALLPVAAVPDPISTTWFCGGGTATGAGEGADLSVVIANAEADAARAVVTFYGDGTDPVVETVDVPVHDRVRVRARDVAPGAWAAATVEVVGGRPTVERRVDGGDGFEVAPCASAASSTWYLPSGSTLRGATETLFLFNPFPDATSVDVTFATDEGALSPQDLTGVAIPPRSLRVITVENPARRREVAATVTTRTGRIVVDRLQTYDGTGDPVVGGGDTPLETGPPRGVASTAGSATASPRWFFPDVRIAFASRTQLAVLNPSEDDADLELAVGFADPDLYEPIDPITISVDAGEQAVVDLTDDVDFQPGMELTLDLRSVDGVPVVAELVWLVGERDDQEADAVAVEEMAGPDGEEVAPDAEPDPDAEEPEGEGGDDGEGAGFGIYAPGVGVTAGSPVAARSWFLAGRGADAAITAEIVVANPTDRPVAVSVVELVDGRRRDLPGASVTVPAGGRVTLDLAEAEPGSPLLIDGDGPVVVGRTLWATTGRGLSIDLATPWPDQVVPLPAG